MKAKKDLYKGHGNKKRFIEDNRFRLTLIMLYLLLLAGALFFALHATNNEKKDNTEVAKIEEQNLTSFSLMQEKLHKELISTLKSLQIDVEYIKENAADVSDGNHIIQLKILLNGSLPIEEFRRIMQSKVELFEGELLEENLALKPKDAIKIFKILLNNKPSHRLIIVRKSKEDADRKKIAIIIDDLGYSLDMLYALIEINQPLTLSIIPHLKYSRKTAQIAHERGYEIMLHLPMEPENYPANNPGLGAILTHMSPDEIYHTVLEDIASLPYITGVNNHMGSKATQDYTIMKHVLKVIKEHNLYFIDSQTSDHTIAYKVAQEMGVPTGLRVIFIDKIQEVSYTEKELKSLFVYAENNGYAIGIGHAFPSTIKALKNVLPNINNDEVNLVFASEIVH